MRPNAAHAARLTVGMLVPALLIAGCSSSPSKKGAASPSTSASAATPAPSASLSPTPTPSASPTPTPSPTPLPTPPPCHARVGKCLEVLSQGDAINVRSAPNTKAKIIRTISSGYQVEVLCVTKGQLVVSGKVRTAYWDAVDQGYISDAYVGAAGRVAPCR